MSFLSLHELAVKQMTWCSLNPLPTALIPTWMSGNRKPPLQPCLLQTLSGGAVLLTLGELPISPVGLGQMAQWGKGVCHHTWQPLFQSPEPIRGRGNRSPKVALWPPHSSSDAHLLEPGPTRITHIFESFLYVQLCPNMQINTQDFLLTFHCRTSRHP